MTDNEIIKALECCGGNSAVDCYDCSLRRGELTHCTTELATNALDLINRQKAEIDELQVKISSCNTENEKLNVELTGMRGACEAYKMHYDKSQAENKELWRERNRIYENLQETKSDLREYRKAYSKAEIEAYKEFVKRFEKKIKNVNFTIGQTWEIQCALKQTLQELSAEKALVNYESSKGGAE